MSFNASAQNNRVSLDNNEVQRVVDTCCLGCVFAQGQFRTKGKDKKLQFFQSRLGCDANVLHKFQKQGAELQDATDKDGNEFYVVRARACPFYRTPNWKGWSEQDSQSAIQKAREEVTLKPDVVLYVDNSSTPGEIWDTIHELDAGRIKPARVYIANNSDMRPSDVMKVMKDSPLPWRAETMIEGKCEMWRALDIITKKCTNMFVTYFQAGYKPPSYFFDPIDKALFDDLDKFVLLEPLPGSINCLTVLRIFYRQADGNARSWIWEKAKKISEDQKCQYLVRPVTEVVTQLSQ